MTRAEKAGFNKHPVDYIKRKAFIDGYQQAEKDLTEWHDPKDMPPEEQYVLLKVRCIITLQTRHTVGYNLRGLWQCFYLGEDDVIGWREIHE